ncbi:MAG TPA: response regulator, partial [Terriglobales bacterium]|nr:response regulator [Terriglobales bacterium]
MNTNEQVGSVEPTAAAILPVSEREEPKSGSNSVAILVIEDCEADACLILKHLQANYYVSYCDVIRSQGELEKVLRARHYDLIVCDYVLSDGNAIQALKVAKAACFDGVFIVVSGSVGEEVAVECIKSGAHEFLRKIHMPRLPLVAAQAFYMKEQQRRAAKAERDVRFAEQRFRALVENSADCVDIIDTEGRMVWISPSCYRI